MAASNLRVDVTVSLQESILDGLSDLVGLRLPGTKTNGGDLVTGVEGVDLPKERRMIVSFQQSPMCFTFDVLLTDVQLERGIAYLVCSRFDILCD